MATEAYAEEMDPASSDEAEPESDFDVAAEAFATELGTAATPGFKRALKEVVMSCMNTGYEPEKAPEEEGGLALIFGEPKRK